MDQSLNNPSPNQNIIQASEQRFRALVTATSDIIYSVNADWSVMQRLDGRGFLADADQPTHGWKAINVYAEDLEKVDQAIAEAVATKGIFQLEHRVNRADGTTGWTFSRAVPIMDENENIIEWFGTASDITEKKLTEQKLEKAIEDAEKQTRLYETLTSATPDLIYVFGLDYRFSYANKALLEMWGKTWDNAVGKRLLENGYEPWHAEMHEREIDKVAATGKPIRGEVSFPHATLGRRVYDYIFTPIFDSKGKVEAVAGTTRDVTERKQVEHALAESSAQLQAINEEMAATNEEIASSNEELIASNEQLILLNEQLREAQRKVEEAEIALRLAIDAANFGTWFIHSKTREFITDARLKELFGYYPDEPLSIEQALAQITDEYRSFVATKLENAIYNRGDYDVSYPVVGLHDNQLRWLRAIGNLKADPSGNFSTFTGVVMDITEQHLASKKIQQAEENLRIAVESGELATWHLSENLSEISASTRFNEIFGIGTDHQLSYEQAIDQIHPEYRQMVDQAVNASFTNGALFNVEYPLTGTSGGKQRWVRSVGKMIADEKNGNYITGVMADITEQKNDELRKNDFIAMVSHELKTPLTSMKGYIQVVLRKVKGGGDEFITGAMQKANNQVEKMTEMIHGFLNLSRLESGKINISPEIFDLAQLIQETKEETLTTIFSHEVIFEQAHPAVIHADRYKIGQVLHNLISNAVKYSSPSSRIYVTCTSDEDFAQIKVADQGMGISQQNMPKIFDRYYRVEDNRNSAISGFGIGLYLCREIISRHQGKIWAESELGKGSEFHVSLPLQK